MASAFRLFGRWLGFLLLLAALLVLGRDLLAWRAEHVLAPISLGELWIELNRASLAAARRDLPALLWDPVMITLLRLWAAPALALPGLLLYWPARKRGR
ncbi:MAG: hypothetical protein KGL11_05355 [Alphaproteobacteria bacterium]|nr:hypothetical protein [Alphaproteobacteria bacterium]